MAVSRPRRSSLRKPSFRDHMSAMNAANRGMEAMFGDRREAKGLAAPVITDLPAKREYVKREHLNGATEAQVLDAIRSAFALHPKVAFCWRMQSGLFVDGDRHIRVGFPGLPDLIGALKGGKFFAVEVKREFGGQTSERQIETLQMINTSGGKAGVARSVEEALAIIQN